MWPKDREDAEVVHEAGQGRWRAWHGGQPVGHGYGEVVLQHVFTRREEGRDRAGPQGRVAEGLGGEVHADVGGYRVNSAGGDDDRVRFCREVVVLNLRPQRRRKMRGKGNGDSVRV
jgi:hypothetical protein